MRRAQNSTGLIIVLLMCCCLSLLMGVGWFFLSKPKEGDKCEGKDPNGVYKINSKGKCVLDSCKGDYYVSGTECKQDFTGDDCTPTSNVITGGIYMKNKSGEECEFYGCNIGYSIVDDSCELDPAPETDPAPATDPAPETDPAEDPAADPTEDPTEDPAADPTSTTETYRIMPARFYTLR